MDKELPCDFYFGDSRPGNIEELDVSLLSNFKGKFHNVSFGPFYWQCGALKLLKSDYTDIITPGDIHCISTWLFLFLAKIFNKRLFFWTHGAYGNEKLLRRWLIHMRYSYLEGIFLYGNYAKEFLINYGVPENKLHVIYNSLDYDKQTPMRSIIKPSKIYQSHFGNEYKNIVFIGRLTKVKKLDQIIKAMIMLKGRNVNLNLTFIGEGTERTMLTQLAVENGLNDRIWFYGALYEEKKIAEFLYNADMCVSPGNVGLTAMHAMSFGTPVITHNDFAFQMPEFEAIEDGRTGTFFERDDISSLANAIERWSNINLNREEVRQNCYSVIDSKYNPHVQISTMSCAIFGQE